MSGAIDQDFNATTDIHREGKFATNQFRKHTGNKPIPVTARKDDAPAAYQEGLVAMADLALNHRLAQGTLGGIVRGFDIFDLKEGPEAIGNWQQLMAGADRFCPLRSLTRPMAQLHHPLKYGHKCLADRPAGLLRCGGGAGHCIVIIIIAVPSPTASRACHRDCRHPHCR